MADTSQKQVIRVRQLVKKKEHKPKDKPEDEDERAEFTASA